MDIRTAVTNLNTLQLGLSIASPVALTVKRVWPYVPPQNVALPEYPAWMNTWDLVRELRAIGLRELVFTVHAQLFAAPADREQDRALDIATAFLDSFITALDANVSLSQSVTEANLRGSSPTLAILERGGLAFAGLDLFIDIVMKEAKNFA
jgi:hypothetical protein